MEFPGQDKAGEEEARTEEQGAGGPQDVQKDGGDGAPEQAPSETQQLAEQLAQAQQQAAEYLDQWRRAAAEHSNARKRMEREKADFQANANARLLERVIPIVDDVDRAFAALPAEEANNEWVNGFRLIQRKMQALLESEGVTTIDAEGQKFDPALHYAVSHEEQPGFEEGDVIAEVAKGYRLGDRVLRPAMVRVAKG